MLVEKFSDPNLTAKGEPRASVALKKLTTLWFNTGTQCNLSCKNCYIESSPTNDRLAYITKGDVVPYLDEILDQDLGTEEIGFTGGEPFLNPNIIEILTVCLERGFKTIVLTNAYRMVNRYKSQIVELSQKYGTQFLVRVSLDHHSKDIHEAERGAGTFDPTLKNLQWFSENQVPLAVAGRALTGEDPKVSAVAYGQMFQDQGVEIDYESSKNFVVFPEMDTKKDVPEITTACWGILDKAPEDIMCSNSRMIVKRKGEEKAKVLACTLIAYDKQFELGQTLKDSEKTVSLNHPFCAQFCVLGGASCS